MRTRLLSRNIDKVGGLDEYLLHTSDLKLDSDVGMQLRQHILEALGRRKEAAEPNVRDLCPCLSYYRAPIARHGHVAHLLCARAIPVRSIAILSGCSSVDRPCPCMLHRRNSPANGMKSPPQAAAAAAKHLPSKRGSQGLKRHL
jgi:hypothetical protein